MLKERLYEKIKEKNGVRGGWDEQIKPDDKKDTEDEEEEEEEEGWQSKIKKIGSFSHCPINAANTMVEISSKITKVEKKHI